MKNLSHVISKQFLLNWINKDELLYIIRAIEGRHTLLKIHIRKLLCWTRVFMSCLLLKNVSVMLGYIINMEKMVKIIISWGWSKNIKNDNIDFTIIKLTNIKMMKLLIFGENKTHNIITFFAKLFLMNLQISLGNRISLKLNKQSSS